MAEAVSFGAPDEKYGEVVAAAVVLSKPADDAAAVIADIRKFAAAKLATFKVPYLRDPWQYTSCATIQFPVFPETSRCPFCD